MRQYNCSLYLSCLSQAAATDINDMPCDGCLHCVICDRGAEDPADILEHALNCCRLLVAMFQLEDEHVPDVMGFKIRLYDGYLCAVRRVSGGREVLRIGSMEQAEEKITRYISMKR